MSLPLLCSVHISQGSCVSGGKPGSVVSLDPPDPDKDKKLSGGMHMSLNIIWR